MDTKIQKEIFGLIRNNPNWLTIDLLLSFKFYVLINKVPKNVKFFNCTEFAIPTLLNQHALVTHAFHWIDNESKNESCTLLVMKILLSILSNVVHKCLLKSVAHW